jgi:hypothetical protein
MFFGTLCSFGTEPTDIQIVAEQFVQHIYLKKQENIIEVFEFTDSFKSIIVAEPKIQDRWAKEIDQRFGNLGSLSNREIVSYNNNVRNVYFYFQGTKRPAKIWIIFKEHKINGIQWNTWTDGYSGESVQNQNVKSYLQIYLYLSMLLFPFFIIFTIFLGEFLRKKYVKRISQDQDNELLTKDIFPYVESQNPLWVHILWIESIIFTMFFVFFSFSTIEFIGMKIVLLFIFIVVCVASILFCGFKVEVNNSFFTLRTGFLRLRLLHIELDSIVSVETITFRPIRDFGGWGIRWGNFEGKPVWAYFMSGSQGIRLLTNQNIQYIIGSDTPIRLVKAIQIKKQSILR